MYSSQFFVAGFGCNEVDICGENAECMLDTDTNIFKCQCIDDFSGDGYSCEPLDRMYFFLLSWL